RVFAAFLPPEQLKAHQAPAGAQARHEPHGRSEGDRSRRRSYSSEPPAETVETVEQVRERGMARAIGDFMAGMSAFAAPVFDDRGRLVLAITVLGYKAGFDHRWSGPVANALRE
ncbi:hypothetical protein IA69_32905, partial [Massilia sp. JS1662]